MKSWKCLTSPSSLKKAIHYALEHPWELILPNEKPLPITKSFIQQLNVTHCDWSTPIDYFTSKPHVNQM